MDKMLNDFATAIDTGAFSCGPEREPAVSRYVDEIEKGIGASILAATPQISQTINEAADTAYAPDYALYRDRHFAEAMAEFERDMNLDDISIFVPSTKTFDFAHSIQQMEKGWAKAKQYLKKIAS